MRLVPQLLVIAALAGVSVPLAARFLPGSHPMLDKVGLLSPLASLGLVPAGEAPAGGPPGAGPSGGKGGPGSGPVPVVAAEPHRVAMTDEISAIGSARGIQAVVLTPEVSGRLLALKVAPGDRVEVGQVIAELDSEAARLAVEKAELVLADARATLERLDRLAGSGATTDLQRQDAELALRTADLALQSAQRDLADHRLTAPIAGFIGLIEADVGDLVTPTTVVTRIEDRSRLIIDFRVPERVASRIAPGGAVVASPVSNPGQTIAGTIDAVDNRVDETSRTLRVQAQIDNPDDALRAGMAFRMTLDFPGGDHPAVDPLAIQWGSKGAFVWIVRGGKAMELPVRILQRHADSVLIDAALEPGDQVVTEGVQALRPGAEVAVATGPAG